MINEGKNIVYNHWLARIFQRGVYELIVDDDLIEKASDQASREYHLLRELRSRPVFMYAKVPTAAVPSIRFLETLSFSLVETNVVFEKPIAPTHDFAGHCVVRFAVPEDKSRVSKLARKSFVYSRFHLDKAIPGTLADTIKAEWVGNYFVGKRGDEMIVALVGETLVGFLLLLQRNNGDLTIDLVAVHENERRKGIGSDMIAYAESRCGGYSRMLVGTQVANIPSIRFYEKIGFRVCASKYVFHYHNLPAEAK